MNCTTLLLRFLREDSGQDLIEYALIASLIALAAVSLMSSVGTAIGNIFTNINNNL